MTVAGGYSLDEAVLLMTLSTYAYIDETPLPGQTIASQEAQMRRDINAALTAPPSRYSAWQVAWGPGLNPDRSNMMYVAGNQTTNQYAVVIRGTDWSFVLDWLEDFGSVLPLVDFPYLLPTHAVDGVQIAVGTCLGFQQLAQMTGMDPSGDQVDLVSFLRSLPPEAEIFVTGHSLGGCLASVVAPWLAYFFGSADQLKVYTFAAPSAGNQSFANYYNALFMKPAKENPTQKESTAYRVYNTLDVVPNAWATLATIETYYDPFPPCPDDVKTIIGYAQDFVGTTYVQVGTAAQQSAVPLPGHLLFERPAGVTLDPIGDLLFLYEAGLQHGSATYLSLLGTAPVLAPSAKLQGVLERATREALADQAVQLPPCNLS